MSQAGAGTSDEDWVIEDEDDEYEIMYFGGEEVLVPRDSQSRQQQPAIPVKNGPSDSPSLIIAEVNGDMDRASTSKDEGTASSQPLVPDTIIADHMGSDDDCESDSRVEYRVVSTDELIGIMNKIISEVNGISEIPPTVARILLIHFKWDKENLLERYYSCSSDEDLKKLFEEARILYTMGYKSPKKPRHNEFPAVESSTQVCGICFDELKPSDMSGLTCNHQFCRDCWIQYLTNKIMEEGEADYISCPTDCQLLVDDEMVLGLIQDKNVQMKYRKLMTNNFVANNKRLQWCPAASCQNVIQTHEPHGKGAKNATCVSVKCSCGFCFCFLCGNEWHEPVLCNFLSKWKMKCDDKDNTETLNYICSYTKDCPKCHVTIEKNGGCNHMTCRKCKHEFCWTCGDPMDHNLAAMGRHNCNKYVDEGKEKEVEKSRAQLKRFLHYCNRYMNHNQSLKFESKLVDCVTEKMQELQENHHMSWIEVQFLKKAVDALLTSRQTLMYTYVFAYYLKPNNQQIIFEENQQDLENTTECLSRILEKELSEEDVADIKGKVVNTSKYCEARRKALVDHVKEGYEKDWWEYNS